MNTLNHSPALSSPKPNRNSQLASDDPNRLACFVALLAMLLPGLAFAVPMQLAQQGRIVDDQGQPLVGSHTLDVVLSTDVVGQSVIWSQDFEVDLEDGYYSVVLGAASSNPLDASLFEVSPLFLGLSVDSGSLMQPLLEVVSTPYSLLAQTATNVDGGFVDASELSVGGVPVIDAQGNWVGGPAADSVDALSCADGQHPNWDSSTGRWQCGFGFSFGDAVAAMGHSGNGNPLNHSRYSDSDAVSAMGVFGPSNALNHSRFSSADARVAMGAASSSNPYNHGRYLDSEAVASMGVSSPANPYNHTRFGSSDAVAAMGSQGQGNPLNHSRYSAFEAVAAVSASAAFVPSSGGTIAGDFTVTGTTEFGGDTSISGDANVGGSASVVGNIDAGGYLFANRYLFQASQSNVASVTGSVFRPSFATEDIDRGGMFCPGSQMFCVAQTHNSMRAPRAGIYQVAVVMSLSGSSSWRDSIRVGFEKNGNGAVLGGIDVDVENLSPRSSAWVPVTVTYYIQLLQGEQVRPIITGIGSSGMRIGTRRFSGTYIGE